MFEGDAETEMPSASRNGGRLRTSSTASLSLSTLGEIRACNLLVRNPNPARRPRACSIPPIVGYCQAQRSCALRSPVGRVQRFRYWKLDALYHSVGHRSTESGKLRIVGSSASDCLKTLTSSASATLGRDRRLVLARGGFHPQWET
jgi:hypothetical protein